LPSRFQLLAARNKLDTLFTLFALPTFYTFVHRWQDRLRGMRMIHPADVAHEVAP
jgi:hypothetical protein